MNKKVMIGLTGLAASFSILSSSYLTFAKMSESESIGSDNALQIALNDSRVNRNEVKHTKSEFEYENGKYFFDVEFTTGNTKYEYDIDASTGKILKGEAETTSYTKTTSKKTTKKKNTKLIGLNKAKSIALKNAGFTSKQVVFTEAKKDYEKGKPVYEVKFKKGSTKYEYEINAKTGKILDIEKKVINKTKKKTKKVQKTTKKPSSKYIGIDYAKKIAVKRSGQSQVKFTKAKMDLEDGKPVYEIEFKKGKFEYECEIDAKTGKILEFEKEKDS